MNTGILEIAPNAADICKKSGVKKERSDEILGHLTALNKGDRNKVLNVAFKSDPESKDTHLMFALLGVTHPTILKQEKEKARPTAPQS